MPRAAILPALCLFAFATACGKAPVPPAPVEVPAEAEPGPAIVLDQFGYRPGDPKIVRIRKPVAGFDIAWSSQPRITYYVRNTASGEIVRSFELTANPEDPADTLSGDQVWTLDISRIAEPGAYRVTSGDDAQQSAEFEVRGDIYKPVLREAFRAFYYQRSGIAKSGPIASQGWTDGASHLGPGQDGEARLFSAAEDAGTTRDLRGGWYDGGEYHQYTNWTADHVRTLLMSYAENPEAWGDDFGIPESGNGVPDVLDEARWGLDWLLRMQSEDGSVLSMLARDNASPPSAAKGPSLYGPASTSASLSAAGAFALAATIFRASPAEGHAAYADRLEAASLAAWRWAEANPDVMFYNNDARSDAEGFGAGQQEVDSEYLNGKRFAAAAYLSVLTGDAALLPAMDAALAETSLMATGHVDAYRHEIQDAALFLARQPGAPPELKQYLSGAITQRLSPDPATGYSVPVDALHGGSNGVMARTGMLYIEAARLSSGETAASYTARALDYLHYLHGANPLGQTYLSNMGAWGAETPVMKVYRVWQTEAAIPGFLVGGPDPAYDWDPCCPASCGSPESNAACGKAPLSPPQGQPPLKSYLDFNEGWPLNSWQVSQTSTGFQAAYVRLLANFVD
jgi:endoglucanase